VYVDALAGQERRVGKGLDSTPKLPLILIPGICRERHSFHYCPVRRRLEGVILVRSDQLHGLLAHPYYCSS